MLERYRHLIFGLILVAIVAGVIALLTYKPPSVVITIIPPAPTATPGPLQIYVTGEVVNANAVYKLPRGSRVSDAIHAAGGFSSNADRGAINLARTLSDGEQIRVPAIRAQGGPTAQSSQKTELSAENPLHINTATVEEIEQLPGVGPVLAKAIFDYRETNGPFKSMAELDEVSGIGPARVKQWEGLISFE